MGSKHICLRINGEETALKDIAGLRDNNKDRRQSQCIFPVGQLDIWDSTHLFPPCEGGT